MGAPDTTERGISLLCTRYRLLTPRSEGCGTPPKIQTAPQHHISCPERTMTATRNVAKCTISETDAVREGIVLQCRIDNILRTSTHPPPWDKRHGIDSRTNKIEVCHVTNTCMFRPDSTASRVGAATTGLQGNRLRTRLSPPTLQSCELYLQPRAGGAQGGSNHMSIAARVWPGDFEGKRKRGYL